MAISVSSAKAKGRRLQQIVVDFILGLHPDLEPDDVVSCPMGSHGADVKLSPAARKRFGYAVECKARQKFALYADYDQAKAHTVKSGGEPLLIVKGDRKAPLVVMSLDHFAELVSRRV